MAAYCTGSDPIEIGDCESKVKVTVTKNVCKNYEKNLPKIQIWTSLKLDPIIQLKILALSF